MVELALVTGWTLDELDRLDDVELATLVDVIAVRHAT